MRVDEGQRGSMRVDARSALTYKERSMTAVANFKNVDIRVSPKRWNICVSLFFLQFDFLSVAILSANYCKGIRLGPRRSLITRENSQVVHVVYKEDRKNIINIKSYFLLA